MLVRPTANTTGAAGARGASRGVQSAPYFTGCVYTACEGLCLWMEYSYMRARNSIIYSGIVYRYNMDIKYLSYAHLEAPRYELRRRGARVRKNELPSRCAVRKPRNEVQRPSSFGTKFVAWPGARGGGWCCVATVHRKGFQEGPWKGSPARRLPLQLHRVVSRVLGDLGVARDRRDPMVEQKAHHDTAVVLRGPLRVRGGEVPFTRERPCAHHAL